MLGGFSHPDHVQRVEHFELDGGVFFDHVVQHQLEGVVSKRKASLYHSGRSGSWVKTKNKETLPFVICGYELAAGTSYELLLAYHDARGHLVYAGRVGVGFTAEHRSKLRDCLEHTDACPLSHSRLRKKTIRWVRPTLVALVEQGAWRGAGFLREAVYLGLLDDIDPNDVSIA